MHFIDAFRFVSILLSDCHCDGKNEFFSDLFSKLVIFAAARCIGQTPYKQTVVYLLFVMFIVALFLLTKSVRCVAPPDYKQN